MNTDFATFNLEAVEKLNDTTNYHGGFPVAGIYQHYKGKLYQVFSCARHSETDEWYVVYQCLYGDYSLWIRPLSLFNQPVELADGQQIARFSFKQAIAAVTAH